MMGYAEARADLARGDDLRGVLWTGDLAEIDADGFSAIVGRRARFVKVLGLRVSLDDVEQIVAEACGPEIAALGDDDRLAIAVTREADVARAREAITSRLRLHASAFDVALVPSIPRTAKGTVDHAALAAMAIAKRGAT
jgi:acyl-CoA synthetase (AMP-forming)/AMP-acid ligase II